MFVLKSALLGLGGLVGAAVVTGAIFFGLSFAGAPAPGCAGAGIPISDAAAASFDQKWEAFKAAAKSGPATATFTEEELTSRAQKYVEDRDLPVKNVQVHLCPGESKGQAAGEVKILGRYVDVVVTGHLDTDRERPTVVIDKLTVGAVPRQITSWLADRVEDTVDLSDISTDIRIDEVTTAADSATLKKSQ